MIAAVFPSNDGTVLIVGVTHVDMAAGMSGLTQPDMIDLEHLIAKGIGLPSMIQIIFVADRDAFDARVNRALTDMGIEPTPFVRVDDMPNIFDNQENPDV